jgi:hypothetical protein
MKNFRHDEVKASMMDEIDEIDELKNFVKDRFTTINRIQLLQEKKVEIEKQILSLVLKTKNPDFFRVDYVKIANFER